MKITNQYFTSVSTPAQGQLGKPIVPQVKDTLRAQANATPDFCKAIAAIFKRIWNAISGFFAKQNTPVPPVPPAIPGAPTMSNLQILTGFLHGACPNSSGVTLQQILGWGDDRLESQHDYIQWLFPLDTPSAFNASAPVLDQPSIQAYRHDNVIKGSVLRAFKRMLSFYGLSLDERTKQIVRAPAFQARAAVWLTPGNHNFQRITRIIRSLGLFGLPEYSRSFYTIMDDIARREGARIVDSVTLNFWHNAVPR